MSKEIKDLQKRAVEIRKYYEEFEKRNWGSKWSNIEIAMGMIGDASDAAKLVAMKEGRRPIKVDDVDEALKHELSDVMWSVFVIANNYDIDLEREFLLAMDGLEERTKGNK